MMPVAYIAVYHMWNCKVCLELDTDCPKHIVTNMKSKELSGTR